MIILSLNLTKILHSYPRLILTDRAINLCKKMVVNVDQPRQNQNTIVGKL
jgi:hypothetical protein